MMQKARIRVKIELGQTSKVQLLKFKRYLNLEDFEEIIVYEYSVV
jgi:hypothetical protein